MISTNAIGTAAACIFLGFGAPAFAAETAAAPASATPPAAAQPAVIAAPAEACLKDVRTFNSQMQKEGYWLGGSGYAYGYPVGGYGYGYGYGYGMMGAGPVEGATGDRTGRPGYEIRVLMASANILAQNGQQQACEDVLTTTRAVYKEYAAELHGRGMHGAEDPAGEQQQINAALPVAGRDAGFRSDQIIDAEVRSPKNETLGSVHDIVLSPQTGKIAYLIVARGGVFGIDRSYVPVPWDDFKSTQNLGMLVLATTKTVMESAPTVRDDTFAASGQFDQESQKVDDYWKAHLKVGG
jgi:sporulation protein YlmC with PRC-barrel domain